MCFFIFYLVLTKIKRTRKGSNYITATKRTFLMAGNVRLELTTSGFGDLRSTN